MRYLSPEMSISCPDIFLVLEGVGGGVEAIFQRRYDLSTLRGYSLPLSISQNPPKRYAFNHNCSVCVRFVSTRVGFPIWRVLYRSHAEPARVVVRSDSWV